MAVLPADVGDWTFSVVYCKFTYLQWHILNYFTLALDPIGRWMAKDMNSGRNEVLTKIPLKWSMVEQAPSRSGGGRGRPGDCRAQAAPSRNCQFYGRFISGHRTSLVGPSTTPLTSSAGYVTFHSTANGLVQICIKKLISFLNWHTVWTQFSCFFFYTYIVNILSVSFPLKSSTNALKALSRTNPKPFSCNQKPRVLSGAGAGSGERSTTRRDACGSA